MRKNNLNRLLRGLDVVPKPEAQQSHPGLGGYSEKEILDFNRDFEDEERRVTGGDISRVEFSTHQPVQQRYIPCADERIERFEEKVIFLPEIQSTREKNEPEDQFGMPCPECNAILVVSGNGCAHCEPVIAQDVKTTEPLMQEIAEGVTGPTRKQNRVRTTVVPSIGKSGYTRQTSPHKTNKGWKPAMTVVQEVMNVGSREAHTNDPALRKKIIKFCRGKSRKNTIAKVSRLEARKQERRGISRFKGKL